MSVILATAGFDHKIRFWEAPSGICSRIIKYPDSQVNRLQITPDKQFIAAAGNPHIRLYEILNGSSAVDAVDPPTQQPVLTLEGHTAAVTAIGFQKDGRYLYSGSEDGTIKVWDLRNPNYSRSFDSKGGVNCVTLRHDRDEFISGDQNGYVKVWDLGGNGCLHSIKPSSAQVQGEQQPQHHHDDDHAKSQQQHRRRNRSYLEGTDPIQAVDISEDSRTVVACSNKGRVFVWQDDTTPPAFDEPHHHNNMPMQYHHPHHHHHPHLHHHHHGGSTTSTSMLLSQPLRTRFYAHNDVRPGNYCLHGKMAPDGRHFVTTGSDGYAFLWNTATWECAQKLRNCTQTPTPKWVYDAAFCADSSYLVTASSDNIARLWNLRTGDVVRQYHGHQSAVTCVALNDSSV
ncbi:Target of rapamycin complex subunit LST8 [Seminavis robusta]|uniref:Target of rapamycin complex subunit LST8 n=1 Tax=Seminavis robusta TaxID=568900 RepID=A0A9N8E5V1_9STRA|nr:Target of rapamycin complex subunit LST8 [Seminavis robusta]|eukprot:Sro652_g181810.1 Target of rapamycin complex subunit LST8 (399) ;mRNA; r:28774-30447